METKKLLTAVVVFAVVLAAMSTVIEAQRGGSGGGGMGGGTTVVAPIDNNNGAPNNGGDNNNAGNNAGAIDVSVSTDKRMYVLGEPIEITVTAFNPTGYPVGVDWNGCGPFGYTIDGIESYDVCPAFGTEVFQPDQTLTQTFVISGGTPLLVGRHTIVGTLGNILWTSETIYESDPVTIRVVEPNNGGM
jgi:hypothetical protein